VYLKEKIIKRLIELINYYYFQYYASASKKAKAKSDKLKSEESDGDYNSKEESESLNDIKMSNEKDEDDDEASVSPKDTLVDLTNQLVIIFGSFSLGSLEHVTKLIKFYGLHEIIFNLIRVLNFDDVNGGKSVSSSKKLATSNI
jgi:hypothetical protein